MARITTVNKSRKALACGRCGTELPVGSAYRWAKPGFRATTKLVRCMGPTCYFRPSELTTSVLSQAYAVQEGLSDDINAWADEVSTSMTDEEVEEAAGWLGDLLTDAATEVEEVAEQYEQANEEWTANGAADNEEWVERAEAIREWVDCLNDAADGIVGYAADFDDRQEWIDHVVAEAHSAADELGI